VLLALDLASRLNGFCAGDGLSIPVAGAFKLAQHGEDLGAMLAELDANLCTLLDRFGVTAVVYEAPILPSRGDRAAMGSLLTRRKLMSVGSFVEYRCHMRGLACGEENVKAIKRELVGKAHASKDDMVRCALKLGVRLPETEAAGQKDAADATGLWLLGLRRINPRLSQEWDRRLWSTRPVLM
jgi:Holliday junction resolvasome RuvABC endonuclease subunit